MEIDLEALAAPTSALARDALRHAFEAWDVQGQLGDGFHVVGSRAPLSKTTGDVLELQRRLTVRIVGPVDAVPPLRLDVTVGGRAWTHRTRAHPIRTYASAAASAASARSVLKVTAEGSLDGLDFERTGSAFVVGGDALVTAYHVVVGARSVRVRMPGGLELRVDRVWALDPVRDVAVLHFPAEAVREAGLESLVIAPAASPGGVGFTAGWPGEVQRRTVAPRFADLVLDDQRVRMSANAVGPGDSGGPMLDEAGRVLGVVVSGRQPDRARDLLQESICLASDPGPALARYDAASAPQRLTHALAEAAEAHPSARALAAVGAIQVPAHRRGDDRRPHVALLREALRQAPGDAVLQYTAGMVLGEVGEGRLATVALAASRRAGYLPAGYSLGHHLLGRGRFEEAAEVFGQTAREGPYRRLGALGQAQALVELGRYDAVEAALAAVLDHDDRFAPGLYLLGIVRLAQGREAEARALVVRLAARPGWARALMLPLDAEALRPPVLARMPRVALR